MAPTTTATTAAGTGAVAQVIEKVTKEYNRTLTKKLLLIDALLVYSVLTALVQVKKKEDVIVQIALHLWILCLILCLFLCISQLKIISSLFSTLFNLTVCLRFTRGHFSIQLLSFGIHLPSRNIRSWRSQLLASFKTPELYYLICFLR